MNMLSPSSPDYDNERLMTEIVVWGGGACCINCSDNRVDFFVFHTPTELIWGFFQTFPNTSPQHNVCITIQTLIKNIGEKYDGDSRLGSAQVGLLGFWGEW